MAQMATAMAHVATAPRDLSGEIETIAKQQAGSSLDYFVQLKIWQLSISLIGKSAEFIISSKNIEFFDRIHTKNAVEPG